MSDPRPECVSAEVAAEEVQRAKLAHFVEQGRTLGGVVHVGANIGQEVPWYLAGNHVPILLFEPLPAPAAALVHDYGDRAPLVTVVCAALGSSNGEVVLNLPADGDHEKASKYVPIPTPGHPWTEVAPAERLFVPMLRFDLWAEQIGLSLRPYDALVIDVQGMELEVLIGFGHRLREFRYLCVECSERPVYQGEPPAAVVIEYLGRHGFEAITPVEEHDDILFTRMGG